jgi:hypothetical protein
MTPNRRAGSQAFFNMSDDDIKARYSAKKAMFVRASAILPREARGADATAVVTALCMAFGAGASACQRGGDKTGAAGSSAPSASGPVAGVVTATASASSGPTKPASAALTPDGKLVGTGAGEFLPVTKTPDCKHQSAEMAQYLLRGEMAIAGREGQIAAVWLVQLPNKLNAQIAFAGYDGDAKQLARGRGIGSARDDTPRIFATGSAWTVAWFDPAGLAFARPTWEAASAPAIEHLSAVGRELSENIGVASTPSGPLVAVAPFGPTRGQLGVFLFASVEAGAPGVKALGVTHHAKNPVRPAVAADADGYYLAWHEEGEKLVTSHFDSAGKEVDAADTLAAPGDRKRERLAMAPTSKGAIALWVEGTEIIARALDKAARPMGPAYKVASGRWATIASAGEGAIVAWVGHDGRAEDQLLAVRLGPDGVPSAKGLSVTDGTNAVKDPPSVAGAGPRVGFGWAEPMGATIASKRAMLRSIDIRCLP